MDDEREEPEDLHELSDAARRGLQRAGVHLMKAAIEVVAGLSAFLEEINAAGPASSNDASSNDGDDERGPQRIEVE
jgi:hypothetical protein